ncbi:MAG: RNA polymerase sigma factor [Clostridia bacterium]|nr:RNA polymerase sigma factor [Clostridia bacterium]
MDNGASSYRRFLDGDESAFDALMEEYFNKLVFFIDRIVNDTAAAEDIAIDTFSDLIVHKGRYNFKVSFKTYLFMIGRSRALNFIKRRSLIRFTPINEEISDGGVLPEETVIKNEADQRLINALKELPEEMRTAVYLIYFEALSYEQAARVMKKNKKQVDNLLYRAKERLRTILEKEELL